MKPVVVPWLRNWAKAESGRTTKLVCLFHHSLLEDLFNKMDDQQDEQTCLQSVASVAKQYNLVVAVKATKVN